MKIKWWINSYGPFIGGNRTTQRNPNKSTPLSKTHYKHCCLRPISWLVENKNRVILFSETRVCTFLACDDCCTEHYILWNCKSRQVLLYNFIETTKILNFRQDWFFNNLVVRDGVTMRHDEVRLRYPCISLSAGKIRIVWELWSSGLRCSRCFRIRPRT